MIKPFALLSVLFEGTRHSDAQLWFVLVYICKIVRNYRVNFVIILIRIISSSKK